MTSVTNHPPPRFLRSTSKVLIYPQSGPFPLYPPSGWASPKVSLVPLVAVPRNRVRSPSLFPYSLNSAAGTAARKGGSPFGFLFTPTTTVDVPYSARSRTRLSPFPNDLTLWALSTRGRNVRVPAPFLSRLFPFQVGGPSSVWRPSSVRLQFSPLPPSEPPTIISACVPRDISPFLFDTHNRTPALPPSHPYPQAIHVCSSVDCQKGLLAFRSKTPSSPNRYLTL